MEFIIHIGTHKTGTSSIQSFLAKNKPALLAHGVVYPLSYYSPKNLNFIGRCLYHQQLEKPVEIIDKAVKFAKSKNAEKILISAESLYAVTWFFGILHHKFSGNYWEAESAIVEQFRSIIPSEKISIVCFFRRQDLFAESIYNELVKIPNGLSESFEEFLPKMRFLLDYRKHIECWERVFEPVNIKIRTYDRDGGDLFVGFMKAALNIKNIDRFQRIDRKMNERLCRDALEYKRIFNRDRKDEYEALLHSKAITHISSNYRWTHQYDDIMVNSDRERLLHCYENGNRSIAKKYVNSETGDETLFLPPDTKNDRPIYPGLSKVTEDKIKILHEQFFRSKRIRTELLLRKIISRLKNRARLFDDVLWPIRSAWYRFLR